MNCKIEGCKSKKIFTTGICPAHQRLMNLHHCQHPNCKKRTSNDFCYSHIPENIERIKEWKREYAREKRRQVLENVELKQAIAAANITIDKAETNN